jgi:hypothetical protein
VDELPRPSEDVVYRELGDESVLVHLVTNRIYALNPTAARFWSLLGSGRGRGEIERELLDEFDVTETEVHAEIDQLVASLRDEGLVE